MGDDRTLSELHKAMHNPSEGIDTVVVVSPELKAWAEASWQGYANGDSIELSEMPERITVKDASGNVVSGEWLDTEDGFFTFTIGSLVERKKVEALIVTVLERKAAALAMNVMYARGDNSEQEQSEAHTRLHEAEMAEIDALAAFGEDE